MKYNKLIFLIIATILGADLSAQVAIGTEEDPHKGAVLELVSDNKGFLGPRVQLESASSPNPIQNPAIGLLVFNIAESGMDGEKVEKDKFYFWSGNSWVEFIYEEVLETEINNRLNELGIPRSAVFHLDGKQIIDNSNSNNPVMGMFDVMKDIELGDKASLYLKQTINETGGDVRLRTDQGGFSVLEFKKGTYSITFTYQFIPSTNAYPNPTTPVSTCTASSYFVDFPLERSGIQTDRARIHNVAYHGSGAQAHHGGSISYVVKIEAEPTYWWIGLGAGQSGPNCNYDKSQEEQDLAIEGFSLMNDNTFVLVSRIGD
ncbi:MAG: hypothetical protein LIO93_12750 [Bacteroidales bacterium]|nr:hypothetical protein [Bacteroidales bacterium]